MKKIQSLLLIFIALLGLSSSAQSQYLWHLEHTDFDGQLYYAFDVLSCSGENCTAGGTLIDPMQPLVTRMFWRSTDGGVTWKMQSPGLLPYQDLKHKHYFSAIQQIDSLNVIAGGDSGYVLRTFDAGNSWERQDLKTVAIIRATHFSDSLTGIILAQENYNIAIGAGAVKIHTTTDGGRHWIASLFTEFNPNMIGNFTSCHSYGNGKFRVFKSLRGPIYTTHDNWQTIDSTKLLIDHKQEDSIYYAYLFDHCNFTNGDTIIAYGSYYDTANWAKHGGLLMRSLDAGASWGTPVRIPNIIGVINNMSSLDRDTVLAGASGMNTILMSTDRGVSWRVDSLILDTNYVASWQEAIGFTNGGHPLAIYSNSNQSQGTPSIIVRGEQMKNKVEQIDVTQLIAHIYPNPATGSLNLVSLYPRRTIVMIDMLGREVFRGMTTDQSTLTVDISSLTRGVYDVLIDRNGRLLNAGKVVVIGR